MNLKQEIQAANDMYTTCYGRESKPAAHYTSDITTAQINEYNHEQLVSHLMQQQTFKETLSKFDETSDRVTYDEMKQ